MLERSPEEAKLIAHLKSLNFDKARLFLEEKRSESGLFALLTCAVEAERKDIATLLLEKGANPYRQGEEEGIKIIEGYLKIGGDPNQKNSRSNTLLMLPCYLGYPKIVKLLLEHKANPNLADNKGYLALNYFFSSDELKKNHENKKQIEQLLKSAGARRFLNHPIEIAKKLKYIKSAKGFCGGMAGVGIDYMMRGREGIEEIDNLLLALGDEDTDATVSKIKKMQKIRKLYSSYTEPVTGKKHRERIQDEIWQELKDDPKKIGSKLEILRRLFLEEKMDEKKIHELFAEIDSTFSDKKLVEKKLIELLVQKRLDKEIRDEIKNRLELEHPNDIVLLDAPNFIQAIVISQTPSEFQEFIDIDLHDKQNIFVTVPLHSSKTVEKQGFATPPWGKIKGKFNKIELLEFLAEWSSEFNAQGIEKPVAFFLVAHVPRTEANDTHAISFAYLPDEKKWAFNGYWGRGTIFINEKELTDEIFAIFSDNEHAQIKIKARVYSSKIDENKINSALENIKRCHKKLTFKSEKKQRIKGVAYWIYGLFSLPLACIGASLVVSIPLLFVAFVVSGCLSAAGYLNLGKETFFNPIETQNEMVRSRDHHTERDIAKKPDGFLKRNWNSIKKWTKENKKLIVLLLIGLAFGATTIFSFGIAGLIGAGATFTGVSFATAITNIGIAGSAAFPAIGAAMGSLVGIGTGSTLLVTSLSVLATMIVGIIFPFIAAIAAFISNIVISISKNAIQGIKNLFSQNKNPDNVYHRLSEAGKEPHSLGNDSNKNIHKMFNAANDKTISQTTDSIPVSTSRPWILRWFSNNTVTKTPANTMNTVKSTKTHNRHRSNSM